MFKFKLWLLRGYIFMVNPKPRRFQKPELPWCPRGPCSTAISTFLCDEWQNSWDIKQYIYWQHWQYHTVLDLTYSTWFNQYLTFKYLGAHKTMIRKWVEKNGGQILPNWRFLIGFTVYMFTTLWIGGDPPVTWVSYLGHKKGLRIFRNSGLCCRGRRRCLPGLLVSCSGTSPRPIPASINWICRSTFPGWWF